MAFQYKATINGSNIYTCLSADIKPVTSEYKMYSTCIDEIGNVFQFDGSAWRQTNQVNADGTMSGLTAQSNQTTATTLATFTGTGTSSSGNPPGTVSRYSMYSDASHTDTTTVDIEVSATGEAGTWMKYYEMSVTGGSVADGFSMDSWPYDRAVCTFHGDDTNVVTVARS